MRAGRPNEVVYAEMRRSGERRRIYARMERARRTIERNELLLLELEESLKTGCMVPSNERRGPQRIFFTEPEVTALLRLPPRKRRSIILRRADDLTVSKSRVYTWLSQHSQVWRKRHAQSQLAQVAWATKGHNAAA